MSYANFSEFLKLKYEERRERNPQYSLRSFSRDLDMSSGRLTNLLKGRDIPGIDSIQKISVMLKLKQDETDRLIDLVTKQRYLKRGTGLARQLTTDEFKLISDWKILTVFTLFQCTDFHYTLDWLIDKTGFSKDEIQVALDRLESIDLIEKKDSFYILKHQNITTSNDIPFKDMKLFHENFIQFALDSLKDGNQSVSDFSEITMCIDRESINDYLKVIADFRAKIDQISARTKKKNDIYQLNIQFFPIRFKKNGQ